jgi:hypothetical protein
MLDGDWSSDVCSSDLASVAVVVAISGLIPAIGSAAIGAFGPAVAYYVDRADLAGALWDLFTRFVYPAWLVLILVLEAAALRSLLVQLAAFAGVGLVAVATAWPVAPGEVLRATAAAGFVAGFAHWLVAGRNAGFALRRTQSPPTGDPRPPHA